MKYRRGNKCPSGILRTSTIDIECANVPSLILSALEPERCQYHLTMQSMHGCPRVCYTIYSSQAKSYLIGTYCFILSYIISLYHHYYYRNVL